MRNKIITLCLVSMTVLISVNGQNRKLEKANMHFADYNFNKAIKQYEQLIKRGNTSNEVYQKLGDAHYLNANYIAAEKWYEMLADRDGLDNEHLYRYAVSLRSVKKYDESNEWIAKLNAKKVEDQRGKNLVENIDYLEQIEHRFGSYKIDSLSINSAESEFSPSYYKDDIVFTTAKSIKLISKKVHNWNKEGFLNLFIASPTLDGDLSEISAFSTNLNTELHESSTAFSKDGKTVYFTRNNEIDGKFKRDNEGISRLQIYRASLTDEGIWSNIESLPFNADEYSVAHPTLNKTEDKLYFSSDMPGTLGQSDIWVVTINEDNTLGTPSNLGSKINTESKETFPYITDDDVLYFASDGHPGLGGMDIFATDIKNIEKSKVINLGEPINSIYDDFSFVIKSGFTKGYFASNRIGGKGSDDIYSFEEIKPIDFECNQDITGVLKDEKSGTILANADVFLYDANNEKVSSTISKSDGSFKLEANCNESNYKIIASKEHYEKFTMKFENMDDMHNEGIDFKLTPIGLKPSTSIGTDLAKFLKLENIYFHFDKTDIRKDAVPILAKVLNCMRTYPNAKIDVRSHTDSRGDDNYNMALSKKRAKGTINYLVAQGIAASRIIGDGYGETQLINNCNNTTKCSDDEHQQNRRSEFITIQ